MFPVIDDYLQQAIVAMKDDAIIVPNAVVVGLYNNGYTIFSDQAHATEVAAENQLHDMLSEYEVIPHSHGGFVIAVYEKQPSPFKRSFVFNL